MYTFHMASFVVLVIFIIFSIYCPLVDDFRASMAKSCSALNSPIRAVRSGDIAYKRDTKKSDSCIDSESYNYFSVFVPVFDSIL